MVASGCVTFVRWVLGDETETGLVTDAAEFGRCTSEARCKAKTDNGGPPVAVEAVHRGEHQLQRAHAAVLAANREVVGARPHREAPDPAAGFVAVPFFMRTGRRVKRLVAALAGGGAAYERVCKAAGLCHQCVITGDQAILLHRRTCCSPAPTTAARRPL